MKPRGPFVDTSAWFALLVSGDLHHPDVQTVYRQAYSEGVRFATSSLILGELYTLLSARQQNRVSYWGFHKNLLSSTRIQVHHPTERQVDAAFDLLRSRPDKTYSFVDATSFVIMRDESIATALTLDNRFAQEGFYVIPALGQLAHETPESYES